MTQAKHNIIALYILQVINLGVPFILMPILFVRIGGMHYGQIIFTQSLLLYPLLIVDYGFNISSTILVSKNRNDQSKLSEIYTGTMISKTILIVLSALILFPAVIYIDTLRNELALVAVMSLAILGNWITPYWYYHGLERMYELATIQGIAKILMLMLILALVRESTDYVVAGAIIAGNELLSGFASVIYIVRKFPVKFIPLNAHKVFGYLKGSWHYFVSSVSASLYLNTTTFVLGINAPMEAVAIYNSSYKITQGVQALFSPVCRGLFPKIVASFSEGVDKGIEKTLIYMRYLVIVILLICMVIFVFANGILGIVTADQYGMVGAPLRILSLVPFFVLIATILSQYIIPQVELAYLLGRIYLFVGIVSIIILLATVGRYGANAAAATVLIAEFLGPILMVWGLKIKRYDVYKTLVCKVKNATS